MSKSKAEPKVTVDSTKSMLMMLALVQQPPSRARDIALVHGAIHSAESMNVDVHAMMLALNTLMRLHDAGLDLLEMFPNTRELADQMISFAEQDIVNAMDRLDKTQPFEDFLARQRSMFELLKQLDSVSKPDEADEADIPSDDDFGDLPDLSAFSVESSAARPG